MIEARARCIHEVTFRGAPFWMRVPTFAEEVWAECEAARSIINDFGPELEVDEDLWRVDLKTAHVICKACVDKDGGEFMVARLFFDRFTTDEQRELLHLLNACRAAEDPSPQLESDDEIAEMAASLSELETVHDAYRKCAGIGRDALVRLAFGASKLAN